MVEFYATCSISLVEPISYSVGQEITGQDFLELTLEIMHTMGIKMGRAMKVQRFIRTIHESNTPQEPPKVPEKNIESTVEDAEVVPSTSSSKSSTETLKRRLPGASSKKEQNGTSAKIPKKSSSLTINGGQESPQQPSCSQSTCSPQTKMPPHIFSRYNTIREMLSDHPQGREIIDVHDNIDTQKAFPKRLRRDLVRKVIAEMVTTRSEKYPPHEAKLAAAIAIVTEFPRLKNRFAPLGYEHFYHPERKTGFLKNRLGEIARKLPLSERKYNTSAKRVVSTSSKLESSSEVKVGSISLLSEEEEQAMISSMNRKDPSKKKDKETIDELMDKTFYNRSQWILETAPAVAQVLKKYTQLKDSDGDQIDLEFNRMQKNKGDAFISKFPSFFEGRLIHYAKSEEPSLFEKFGDEKNSSLKALLILIGLLPSKKTSRKGSKNKGKLDNVPQPNRREPGQLKDKRCDPQDSLLKISTDFADPGTYIRNVRREGCTSVQPYILGLGTETKRFYFVVADDSIFSRKNNTDLVSAFDLLFKIYYVFNLGYPPQIQYFYNFIETYIYGCKDSATDAVADLYVTLCSIEELPPVQEKDNSLDESYDSD
ncbi:hypothetical protein QAD02_017778 [Eretmocerus hayati]|uniref:Uncharacterized protein n=1 Tax=Eretmocerus hayati TaxID=131215 RepID=A0ACC2PGP9_9HYME|nr:hypothetical protein QAD02_017778 [Eretmocerus hayati]